MKKLQFNTLLLSMVVGISVALMGFSTGTTTNREAPEELTGAPWLYESVVSTSGTIKAQKDQKGDYLLFNPDHTAIVFENGQTATANWGYNDITKVLTINFIGNSQEIREYVIYSIRKNSLQLINIAKNAQYNYKR